MKETREENHMAKTHRSITQLHMHIWGLFGINYVFFVVNSTAGPFRGINFELQLQSCLRQRINVGLQLPSGPLQEFKM